jgi:hypothetical protein
MTNKFKKMMFVFSIAIGFGSAGIAAHPGDCSSCFELDEKCWAGETQFCAEAETCFRVCLGGF